jgi:ParB-like chromosome segregation protein Spo0J
MADDDKNVVKMGFKDKGITLPLSRIAPLKKVKSTMKVTSKYQCIETSIAEVGVIEPLIVYPQNGSNPDKGTYLLLDGHLRFEILKDQGKKEVFCLVSTDDEGYTYNRHVNRLSAIQEHMMIMKAIRGGVDEERLARTLGIDLAKLKEKRLLIRGICDEAVDLLKEKQITPDALRHLKKVKPMRQIEMAELMVAANNYTKDYVRALYLATPSDMLAEQVKEKSVEGMRPEDISRMEKEMEGLERDFKMIEESYAQNVLKLVLARGYLGKLLNNARIVRFLSSNYPEILAEFQIIVDAASLEGKS